jgi:hypothetical protein
MAYSMRRAKLIDNKRLPAFLNLKHEFGRFGLPLEADAA